MMINNFDNSKIASNTYDRRNATKDRYWKRQEALAESGRNSALLTGGLLYGVNVFENRELQKLRKKHLANLRTHYNDIGNTISKLKSGGRKTYQAYFDWATAQHPVGGIAGDLQNATNTKYRNVLNEYASTLNRGNAVRQQLRTDIRNSINKIRETSGKNLFRVSGYNAGMLGLVGLSGALSQHKLNEARAKRQEAGYASEKTASSNLPDRLRYTHTIDTEIVPDEVVKKLNLLEAIKKHKKELAYGAAASAIAGGALYAAHKHRQAEKTAGVDVLSSAARFNYLANAVGLDLEKLAAAKAQVMIRRRLSPGKSVSAWTGKTTGRRLRSTNNASSNTSKALVPTKSQSSSSNLQSPPQSQSQTSKPQTENKGFQFSKRTKTYATMGVAAGATGAAVGHMMGGKSEKTAANKSDSSQESFFVQNKVPLAIGASLVGAGLLAYKGRRMFMPKKLSVGNSVDDVIRNQQDNLATAGNSFDDVIRKQQDNLATAERAFAETKVNTMNNIADRHAAAQKTMKESLDNMFNPNTAAERAKQHDEAFARMDEMLKNLNHNLKQEP